MNKPTCRACRHQFGELVVDLGEQPACDYFPRRDDPGPDPVYPLQMWLCARCGLAQLADDPTVPEEPRATEPAVLVEQAADAVGRAAAEGFLPGRARVVEYGSPHGGSWLDLLRHRGLVAAGKGEPAEVIVDCFGLMHAADQSGAVAERVARLASGGVLLVQYHSLEAIMRQGQWNALRHGHYAYYSTTALVALLGEHGLAPVTAWRFALYGGTVLLAVKRAAEADGHRPGQPAGIVAELLADDAKAGVKDADELRRLQAEAQLQATGLRDWLEAEAAAGRLVLGYGAASRAVALLCKAGVDRRLLPAVIDASPAKQCLRMPGTDIPIVSPARLAASPPDSVLLFVPDLRTEVSAAFGEVEASGGAWVDADCLTRRPAAQGKAAQQLR
jgi:hypothetical protein